ncbi:MAG: hypothetical protein ACOY0T_28825 [Myxococcota bacterium]
MESQECLVLPTDPAEPWLVPSLIRLLAFVDALPSGATGSLSFGEQGAILVDQRRICWAVSNRVRESFTDILCAGGRPSREQVRGVYRACRERGQTLTEGLMADGLVSQAGLRQALAEHHAEALRELAQALATPRSFADARTGYDPRFAFSTTEMLVLWGSASAPELAMRASTTLAELRLPEVWSVAFVRTDAAASALPVAVDPSCNMPLTELIDVVARVISLFDVVDTFDPHVRVVRATCCSQTALVAFRDEGVHYLLFCASRAAAARVLSALTQRERSSFGARRLDRAREGLAG